MSEVLCKAMGCKYNKNEVCSLPRIYIGAYHTDPRQCRSFELKDELIYGKDKNQYGGGKP